MPSNPNVSLDVRNWAAQPGDGYTTSQDNSTHSYKYTGGTETANDGSVVEHGRGAAIINIQLNSDSRYSIDSVTFKDDTKSQLSSQLVNPTRAQINDLNSQVETAEYIVHVRDAVAGCVFECDPTIRNDPN